MPSTGRQSVSTDTSPRATAASVGLGPRRCHPAPLPAEAVPSRRGDPRQHEHEQDEQRRQQRHDEEHPDRHDGARPRAQRGGVGATPAPGQEPEQGRLDVREEVRDADEVGEDVVAVEADDGHELARHLHELGGDDEEQRVPAERDPERDDRDAVDRVEVEAAEVDAQAAPAVEAVRVGDVGVERRPTR